MKLYLQYTNQGDKRYIKEASILKTQKQAEDKGWKYIGSGMNKITYKKSNIVVKFARPYKKKILLKEISKYFSTPKYYRKYFARIFGGDKNKIIQRYLSINIKPKYTAKECVNFDSLKNRLKVWDVSLWHNMSIINNKPIIYDFGC